MSKELIDFLGELYMNAPELTDYKLIIASVVAACSLAAIIYYLKPHPSVQFAEEREFLE